MSTFLSKPALLAYSLAALAFVAGPVNASDPGLRLYMRLHPGTHPPASRQHSYQSSQPRVFRSYSYEPAVEPAVEPAAPTPPPCEQAAQPEEAGQTQRSFSYEPQNTVPAVSAPARTHSHRLYVPHIERKLHPGKGFWN